MSPSDSGCNHARMGSASEPVAPRIPLRDSWFVLFIVATNSALNSFLSVQTSSTESVFADALFQSTSTYQIKKISDFYSYFLATVTIGMTPGMLWAVKYEGTALAFSIVANVSSTWMRWWSIKRHSYAMCAVSVFINASGVWTILSIPAQISRHRFPPHLRTLTTSLAVQASYFGWFLGCCLPPKVTSDVASLETLCLVQAVFASPLCLLFLIFYKPLQTQHSLEHPILPNSEALCTGGFRNFFHVSWLHPSLMVQIVAYGLLGGVGFAFPSLAVFILVSYGFSEQDIASVVNAVFIGFGIFVGVLIGRVFTKAHQFRIVLIVLFCTCTACLSITAVLVAVGFVNGTKTVNLVALAFLFAASGGSSCGFVGVAIEAAALYPVGPAYVCWGIEIILQASAGGLSFWAANEHGLIILAVVAGTATVLVLPAEHHAARLPMRDSQCSLQRSNLNRAGSVEDFVQPRSQ